jgi:hypothetical protein
VNDKKILFANLAFRLIYRIDRDGVYRKRSLSHLAGVITDALIPYRGRIEWTFFLFSLAFFVWTIALII